MAMIDPKSHSVLHNDVDADTMIMRYHHIPCEIQYNGMANVSAYFICHGQDSGKSDWPFEASFRGRPWRGREFGSWNQSITDSVSMMKWNNQVHSTHGARMKLVPKDRVIHWEWDPMSDDLRQHEEASLQPWNNALTWMHLTMMLDSSIISTMNN